MKLLPQERYFDDDDDDADEEGMINNDVRADHRSFQDGGLANHPSIDTRVPTRGRHRKRGTMRLRRMAVLVLTGRITENTSLTNRWTRKMMSFRVVSSEYLPVNTRNH